MSLIKSRLTIVLVTFVLANLLFAFIDYLRGQEITWLYNLAYSTFVIAFLSLRYVYVSKKTN